MELVSEYLKETITSTLPEEIREERIQNMSWFNYGPKVNDFIHKGILITHEERSYRVIVQFKRKSNNSTIFTLRMPVPNIIFEVSMNEDGKTAKDVLGVYNGMSFTNKEQFIELGIPKEVINKALQRLVLELSVEE